MELFFYFNIKIYSTFYGSMNSKYDIKFFSKMDSKYVNNLVYSKLWSEISFVSYHW